MRNNSTIQKGKKKIHLHNFKVSSTTVFNAMTNKGWKALKRERRRTCNLFPRVLSFPPQIPGNEVDAHADVVPEGFGNLWQKTTQPVPGSQIAGKVRKSRKDAKVQGARKFGAGREKGKSFLPFFFFRVLAFSIPLARLSRSLEQAKDERPVNSGDLKPLATIWIIF